MLVMFSLAVTASASAAPRVSLDLADPPSTPGFSGVSIRADDDQGGVDSDIVVTLRLEVLRGGAVIFNESHTGTGGATVLSTLDLESGDLINVYTTSAADPASPARTYTYDGRPSTQGCIGSSTVTGMLPSGFVDPDATLQGPAGESAGALTVSGDSFTATFGRTIGASDSVRVSVRAYYANAIGYTSVTVAVPAVQCTTSTGTTPTPNPGPVAPPVTIDETGPTIPISASNKTITASASGVVAIKIGPVTEDTTGKVTLKTDTKVTISAKKVVALGSKSFVASRGKTVQVKVALSRKNRALLKKLKKIRVRAAITLRDAMGNATVRNYRFTLKTPKP